jgi:hypothetical protein
MANDESPKIEPTLTSVSDAPSVVPAAEIPAPDAVKAEGSTAETAKVEPKPAMPKSEDILAELARANAKNNVFLKPDSILAEVARAKAAAAKPESGLAEAATANAKPGAPRPDPSFPSASRLYIEPSAEKEPKLERKPKPEAKVEPTPEAKRQAYRSSVVVRMPPGSSASDAGVVMKPNVTRLALVAALMAIAASFGAVGGSVGVAKFGPIFASAPPPVAPVTKDNVAEEVKALKDTVAQLRQTTKSLSDNLAALKSTVATSSTGQNTQISKVSDALDRVEKAQADLRKTAAAAAAPTAAPAHMASTTQATAATSDVTGSVKQQQPVPMVLGEPPQNLKPPIVPGWVLRRVYDGAALIEGRDGIIEVETGSVTPGLGRIEGIKRQDGRWVVVTSRGLVIGR